MKHDVPQPSCPRTSKRTDAPETLPAPFTAPEEQERAKPDAYTLADAPLFEGWAE